VFDSLLPSGRSADVGKSFLERLGFLSDQGIEFWLLKNRFSGSPLKTLVKSFPG